jgi:transcriptional regulator with XRE-family HTH domain
LGDHIRKRRLDLGLLQRQVAGRIGVNPDTVHNWETNATTVALKHVPAVVEFLGYVPFPEPASLAERLRLYRKLNGISRRELAGRIGADESTVWRWEAGLGSPNARSRARLAIFLPLMVLKS